MTPSNRLALSQSVDSPAVPVVEMVSSTRREEARSVMALVAGLLDNGVPERDIAVVVRSLDRYEEPLFRAALQHGVVVDMWTQLRVTQTRPFALVIAVCEALANDEVDKHTLLQPLEHRWTPPMPTGADWPMDSESVQRTMAVLPEDELTHTEWADLIREAEHIDDRVSTYLHWLDTVPAPQPETAAAVISDVVDTYAAHSIPVTEAADSPALLETETDASAVKRMRKLADQMEHKLGEWLDTLSVEQSWATVSELATVMATQRPGSREHSHARAVDVLEANDTWGLNIPYIIVAGLTASEWPKSTTSTLQPEFEDAILRGGGDSALLAPNTSWTPARDRDHLADSFRAAGRGVIVTRYNETMDGQTVHPSPFLQSLDMNQLTDTEIQQLRSPDGDLPVAISTMLPESEADTDD